MFIDYHDIPGMCLVNGCMAASGSVLKWFTGMTATATATATATGTATAAAFAEMDRVAGVVFGLTLGHTKGHIYRAIMEGVAYGFRHHLEVLGEMGLDPSGVLACDGGATSAIWRQILADVLGRPVSHVGGHPGSCAGVAFVAGVACGLYEGWDEVRTLGRVTSTCGPRDAEHRRYTELYRMYRGLYGDLKERFRELARSGLQD